MWGSADNALNAVLGTLSETLDTMGMTVSNGWKAIVPHRSDETSDTFIADQVVGLNIGQIETGSLSRSERMEKYNRLLEIEVDLGELPGLRARPFLLANPTSAGSDAGLKGLTSIHFGFILRN